MRNSTDTKSCVGNATDGTDKRTLNQNRRLYWLLNELGLKDSVADLVSDETNGTPKQAEPHGQKAQGSHQGHLRLR